MKQFVAILFFVATVAVADPTIKADDSFEDNEVSMEEQQPLKDATSMINIESELSPVLKLLTKFIKENNLGRSDLKPKELHGTVDFAQYGFPTKMAHMLKAMEKQGLQKGVLEDLGQVLKEMFLKQFGLEETKVDSEELSEQYEEMVKRIEEFKEQLSSESEEGCDAEGDWGACLLDFVTSVAVCITDVDCYIKAITTLVECLLKESYGCV